MKRLDLIRWSAPAGFEFYSIKKSSWVKGKIGKNKYKRKNRGKTVTKNLLAIFFFAHNNSIYITKPRMLTELHWRLVIKQTLERFIIQITESV